jgi:hypothetical protein
VTEQTSSQLDLGQQHAARPPRPIAALVPGIVLLFSGLWMVTDRGPLAIGWAFFAVGLALLIVGAVAQGVAWGLELHSHGEG